jgi:ribosomal protein L6P/L9E
MRIGFAHFPINVEVKGDILNINNIIGERFPRTSQRLLAQQRSR